MQNRQGEHNNAFYRSRRLCKVNGQWYFETREGMQFGPYERESEAKCALAIFIAAKLSAQNGYWLDVNGVRYGAQDGVEYMVEELLTFINDCRENGETIAITRARYRLEELGKTRDVSNRSDRIKALEYALNIDSVAQTHVEHDCA